MPDPDEFKRKVLELEEKVRILQLENDQLAERAEDTLLLGLIAEQISMAEDIEQVLEYGLERISVLKDVPFCACCLLTGNKATIVKSYLSFSDKDVRDGTIVFPETVLLKLAAGDYLLNRNQTSETGISGELKTGGFVPLSAICIPFRVRYTGANMFFFADDQSEDRLSHVADMLRRVAEMMTARIDNISLFQELQALNSELDRKVEERTRELQDSENRFRQFFENQPAYCYMVSPDGVILDVNKSALKVLGYRKEEIVGRPLQTIYAPEHLPKMMNNFEKWKETGKLTDVETVILSKSGERRTVLLSSDVVKDAEGNSVHSVSVQQDITKRKQSEEAVRRANKDWAQTFDAIPDMVMVLDTQHRILRANKVMTALLERSEEELIGKFCFELVHGKKEPPTFCPHFLLLKDGKEHSAEVFEPSFGRSLDIRVSPLSDEAGTVTGSVHVVRDVTEQKNLQKQLIQAQKLESIGTLAGGIAHDFNNLLQIILGYSDMLLFKKKSSDLEYERLHAIRQAARDGSELTKRILAFSRKLEPDSRPVSLNNEINRIEKMLRRTIPKMIRIELHLADDLMAVNADPGQMEQILLNLAVNAQHAMPDGGLLNIETANVTLSEDYARTHLNVFPGNYALLTVSDTGHGMNKEVLEHIFEPFYTTKAPGVGTGLGLAMVFGIVKSHKGHIFCYSELGAGTTFKIYLPAVVQAIEQDVVTRREMPAFGSETILLVDDEDSIREVGGQFLTEAGYKVLTATNGREAIEVYRSSRDEIALVLLDLIMPDMGGKQCLEQLLQLDPAVKVVIASGYTANHQTKDVIASGAKGFVSKPYGMRDLLAVVRRVLDAE